MAIFERHPLSKLFPDITKSQFDNLKKDIEQNGQQVEGKIFEGKVLDGWHRYLIAGDNFKHSQFEGSYKDAAQYVMSINIHRRHLTDNQRFCIAAELQQIMKNKNKSGNNQFTPKDKLCKNNKGENRTDITLSKALNVSSGSIYRALHLKKHAPEKFEACKNGEMSVCKAWTESKREMSGTITDIVEEIKFPDSYSHFTEIEKFLKQISMHGWNCCIYSKNGRFLARFHKEETLCKGVEHNITRAVVTALLDVRQSIILDLSAPKIKALQSQAV